MDAVRCRQRVQSLRIAVDCRNAVSRRNQRAGDRAADPAGRTGDEDDAAGHDLSTVIPAALMTGPQRSISAFRCTASSAWVEATTRAPSCA